MADTSSGKDAPASSASPDGSSRAPDPDSDGSTGHPGGVPHIRIAVIGAVGAVLATVAAAIVGAILTSGDEDSDRASADPTEHVSTGPTATDDAEGTGGGEGESGVDGGEFSYTYELPQGWGINLASRAADHDQTAGEWTEVHNFEWFGKDAEGGDGLSVRGWPDSISWLADDVPSSHEACLSSPLGNGDETLDGLEAGERLCVMLDDFHALVTIAGNTSTPGGAGGTLTIDVHVWA